MQKVFRRGREETRGVLSLFIRRSMGRGLRPAAGPVQAGGLCVVSAAASRAFREIRPEPCPTRVAIQVHGRPKPPARHPSALRSFHQTSAPERRVARGIGNEDDSPGVKRPLSPFIASQSEPFPVFLPAFSTFSVTERMLKWTFSDRWATNNGFQSVATRWNYCELNE